MADSYMVTSTGVAQAYLARILSDVPHVDRSSEEAEAKWPSLQEFKEKNASNQALMSQLNNKVKVCPNCGKGCGYVLKNCNSCNTSIENMEVTFTDNVFMGFVYGVGKGRFPFKISIRSQTPDFLCFDDPLSLSPVHLNVIPTSVFCPDCRFLFKDPAQGLKLVTDMFNFGAEAALRSFWSDPLFKKKFFNDDTQPTAEQMMDIVGAGMNFPPSMFQLHLQFIHPPLLPMHYTMAVDELHFSHKRFIPLTYLKEALSLGSKARMVITENTPIEDIFEHLNKLGVNYDSHHVAFMRRVRANQQKYAKWDKEDFDLVVLNGKAYTAKTKIPMPSLDAKAIQKEDEKKIQNYGRPYVDDKPSGTYYKFAKKPGEVPTFPCGRKAASKSLLSSCIVCS